MIQRLFWLLAGTAVGGASFLLGLYATFPSDVARERATYEFGEMTKHEYAIDIDDLSLWRLSGVALDDVTFYTVKKGRKTKDDKNPPSERTPLLHFDGLSVRAAPLQMLLGKTAAAFVAQTCGGAIDGAYAQSEELIELSFDAEGIDLGQLPLATNEMRLNLLGVLSGVADLSLDQADVKQSSGTLRISFDGLGLGPDSAVAGFGLPEVKFSSAAVAFEAKDGKLEVTEGEFEGDTLTAALTGDIVLNKKLARSRNRLELAFTLPEDLDRLAQIAPDLKRSRDEDGKYHLNIGGTLLSPSVRFTRAGGKAVKAGNSVESKFGDRERPSGEFDPSMNDDERRAAREQRIKDRRDRLRKRREEAGSKEDAAPRDQPDDYSGDEFDEMDEPMDDGPSFDGPLQRGPNGPNNRIAPRFPPDQGNDGGMDGGFDGPMDGGGPGFDGGNDEGMPPDFEPNE